MEHSVYSSVAVRVLKNKQTIKLLNQILAGDYADQLYFNTYI